MSQAGGAFAVVSSLPSGAAIAADRKNDSIFYAASGSKFLVSTDGGKTFATTAGNLGSSTSPVKVVVNPESSGDAWVSTDKGLFHTTNTGASFTATSGITQVCVFPFHQTCQFIQYLDRRGPSHLALQKARTATPQYSQQRTSAAAGRVSGTTARTTRARTG